MAVDGNAAFAAVPFGFMCCFWIFGALFVIAATAFWIWTLVDCVKNEPSEGNDKIVWVLVIVLAHWIGALVYLIVRRPERRRLLGK
jgi:hypothetical protein